MYSSPWITLPTKEFFPDGMGSTIDNIMWERPYVESENEWSAMDVNDGSGNTCIPPVDDVKFSQTLRRTQLYHKAVHSPYFCVTDLLYAGKRESQMKAVEEGLGEIVKHYWIKWNRDGFTNWSRKYVVEPGMSYTDESDGMTFPATPALGRFTPGVWDYFYNMLTLEQAAEHALSTQNSRPVFGLMTDQLTMRNFMRGDDVIREDFRNSSKSDSLLEPLGVSHTYNGAVLMLDEMPPRYNFNPDADPGEDPWVSVPEYILDETDPASPKKIVNPDWVTAEAQDSYIIVKNAWKLRVPKSITSASKANFEAQSWMGDFKWQNVINIDESSSAYNPDGKLGRFRGVLAAGFEPLNPHIMITVRHKVCPLDLGLVDCPVTP